MATRSTLLFVTLALAALLCSAFASSMATSRRHLVQTTQTPPLEGCSASPGSQTPPECSGTFSGNQWDKNELECHVPQGYQLKCSYNHEVISSNKVDCNIDAGPLSSEIKFSCPVDDNCQINCNWADVQGKLPGATYPSIRRILTAWKPRFEVFG
jgi:hypothetical protein